MSSCEAEFISLTEATKEVLWLTYFLDELQIPYDTPVILTDSKSAMEWTKNACHHQRTKHVALKYFFIRDIVRDRKVKIQYVSTKENQADILTKSTSKP
jgi:viroplasmin and RNaseH domain-containing protein